MKLRSGFITIVLLSFSLLSGLSFSAQSAPTARYKLTHKFTLGGDGGWDYLTYDPVGQRVFISRSTRVLVVDSDSGKLITEIPDTDGVHGIALAQDLGKGFISDGKADAVTVFNLKTLKETARIKVTGENPDCILYDPVTKRVFTFNGHSSNATVIDARSDKVIATLALDGKPEFAVADGNGQVFVNIESKSELTRIDARKPAVVKTWSLAPCESPSGLAIDRKHRRLFSGCDNKLMAVTDADTGKVIQTLPIGEGVDATRFDPDTGLAFSSNGEGTLTVIHEDSPQHFSVLQDAQTQKFARTMALNTRNHDVYLVTADVQVTPPTTPGERPHRAVLPGTFTLLVMSKQQ
ncbi:MAG: YncE family protein [Gammaproteobacteria bacterium]